MYYHLKDKNVIISTHEKKNWACHKTIKEEDFILYRLCTAQALYMHHTCT